MKKLYFLFFTLILTFQSNLKAQDVSLPEGFFREFLINNYPSCFINVDSNGRKLLDTTCTAIRNEDSLNLHNMNTLNLDGLQYFTSLKYLDVSNNRLNHFYTIPNSILYLNIKRTTINGSRNVLPDLLPNTLRYLNIAENDFSSLPLGLPDSLRYFNCAENKFTTIPDLPSKLDTFICSKQSSSFFAKLSSYPTLPSTLKYFDCSSNALSSITGLPEGLVYLNCAFMFVYTDYNNTGLCLYSLPSLPQSLQYLYCGGNGLSEIPTLPEGLLTLDCKSNIYSLVSLPALPSGLKYLDCYYNLRLYCLPHIPESLDTLIIESTGIKCLPNTGNYIIQAFNSPYEPLPICDITNDVNQCKTYPVISGKVFSDNNGNGIKDAEENFLPNVRVYIEYGQSGYTSNFGEFGLRSDIGTWSLKVDAPYYYTPVPSSYTYTFNRYDTSVNAIFALQPIASVDSLIISIVPINPARPGFHLSYLINYLNVGTTTVSPNIEFNYNNNILTYNSSNNTAVSNSGSTLSLSENNITPYQRKSFISNFHISPEAVLGDTLTAYANISVNSTSSSDSTFSVVTGSFDPNDKQGTPNLSPQQVAAGKYIDYLIRFQNTGTDTAFNIVVTDTLNALLNDASFQLVNTSHPCRVTRKDNKVGFEFLNIQLPDSIVNETSSHGFIRFRIKPQTNVTLNTVIPNEASIYFDYNARVLTNTASTKIAENSSVIVPPIPATISTFSAFTNTDVTSALLRWNTIGEFITDHFEIEEKIGSGIFRNIGTEPANGNGNNSYSYNVSIPADEVYYRIKMVNRDGSFSYSDEVIVTRTTQSSSAIITIFNNPVTNTLQIVNNYASLNNSIAKLINAQGQIVMSFVLTGNRQNIDVAKLPSGIYYIKTKASIDRLRIINR